MKEFKLGKWISNNSTTPFYVRKVFNINKEIKSAFAYVCGLGQFNFYINGDKVSDNILDPGWTNYNKLVQYVKFDVSHMINVGENVLGGEVGNGWFIKDDTHYTFNFPSFMPPNPNPYKAFSNQLVYTSVIEVEYVDGTSEKFESDESYKVKSHCVQMSNVFGSELMDGRLFDKKWNKLECDESTWKFAYLVDNENIPKGKVVEQTQNPIKVLKTYDGSFMHELNGRLIYDFKQNMSGVLEVVLSGKKGDIIKFYPAEKLNTDGDVDQMAKNWMMIDSCITYIIGEDNALETFEMKFTYFAGRFIAIETSSENIKITAIKGKAISSANKQTGTFTCDDERYLQIYSLVEKAVEANMLSVHTDCPTIERFAWQEPNHLMAPSIMYMKDVKNLWEKFITDLRIDQHQEGDYFLDYDGGKFFVGKGLVPSQAPCYIHNVLPVPTMGSFYDIIPWGSTIILGTYWHYEFYGDKKIIEDNYNACLNYLDYLQSKVTKDGFINHGLGDWGNPNKQLDRENVETVFLYADTKVLIGFAELMHDFETKEKLEVLAEQIKNSYNEKLLVKHPTQDFYYYKIWNDADNRISQPSQALPLYWGMVPSEKEADVAKAFEVALSEGKSFVGGEVSLPYIIQTAKKYGFNKLISEYILKPEHPSYYAFVLDGETTLGEYWEENPRSHCHDMMGHIVEWYYNGIAGITPLTPGFKSVLVKPYMPETMNSFECTFNSTSGEIKVKVNKDKKVLEVSLEKGIEYKIDTTNLLNGFEVIVNINSK